MVGTRKTGWILLLASLAGTLILARYVEAQTVEDNYERLNNFEKTFIEEAFPAKYVVPSGQLSIS